MALETATTIDDLVDTNPVSGDDVSQGDDHIRMIKDCIQNQKITNGTAVNASGTSVTFSSIPSWAKTIRVSMAGLSTTGTSPVILQIGDAGGVEFASYTGAVSQLSNASAVASAQFSLGFALTVTQTASTQFYGVVTLVLLNASNFRWACSFALGDGNSATTMHGGGEKALSATLDRVRITTVGGADTFDAGAINIQYDG